jgi:hypothetical protein
MHTHHLLFALVAACGGLSCSRPPEGKPPLPPGYTLQGTGDLHDFDFLAGTWRSTQRRLKARGVGSHDWDEFPGDLVNTRHIGGVANVDEVVFPTKGWSGLALRTFDVAKRQWAIYWVSSRRGVLDLPPVVGGFTGDRGEFYGEDVDDGRPIKVRFVWTRLGPDKAHWEQACSYDGSTWETNWVNDFERVRA